MFPVLYHTHHSLHPEDLPFWQGLAEQQPGYILELGCGTGRVLLPLRTAGYPAIGIDNDPAMLRFLRGSLPLEQQKQPPVFLADMAHFHLSRPFSLIILPCNTLSTLPKDTRYATLSRVYTQLSPGGLFAASLPNPAVLTEMPRRGAEELEETFMHPLSRNPVQVSSAWKRSSHKFTVTWHYDHLLPDGQVERLTAQAAHSLEPLEVYCDELARAGLQIQVIYGDFNLSLYTSESPYLILLATKN